MKPLLLPFVALSLSLVSCNSMRSGQTAGQTEFLGGGVAKPMIVSGSAASRNGSATMAAKKPTMERTVETASSSAAAKAPLSVDQTSATRDIHRRLAQLGFCVYGADLSYEALARLEGAILAAKESARLAGRQPDYRSLNVREIAGMEPLPEPQPFAFTQPTQRTPYRSSSSRRSTVSSRSSSGKPAPRYSLTSFNGLTGRYSSR